MHELSIAVAVIERAEDTAREHGATGVESVRLRVGALAGVVAESLRFAFEVAREDTALHGARLLIEEVPARARCTACPAEFAVGTPPELWCPRCDSPATELLSGRELELTEVDLTYHDTAGGARRDERVIR
ncbi:hydrogenase maturation nickel metallochaperone HypA [Streptomyces sp. ACA25]|uniref:hydrogenase maturation nickel metallochaperone HypA n=1 Tax=Streptomyces sp. ACA25 TaxID=3022596 RepID=UPI002307813C|nr:hydrogenase maturation nickel metallochaperone HypA [Streptomyces sp. ACA25]MDB1088538.1 hydrogenase maturation nickel metallochaperone HypA [Streptomyces sp. ACA25]